MPTRDLWMTWTVGLDVNLYVEPFTSRVVAQSRAGCPLSHCNLRTTGEDVRLLSSYQRAHRKAQQEGKRHSLFLFKFSSAYHLMRVAS